jgi:GDP-L-fucose synthase
VEKKYQMSIFKNRNILVTGGTGMVGVALTKILINQHANVTVCSLDDVNPFNEDVIYIKKDLRDYNNCVELCKQKDFIFHLAGIKGSPTVALKKPASFFVPTVLFNTCLLEAAFRAQPQHILYTSSVGVYSPAEIFYEDDVWKTFPSENDRFAGWAKRMGELQLESYKVQYNYNNYSIVRPANVYGPYDNFDEKNAMVVPSLIRRVLESKDTIEVWGDGSQVRDFIYSEDVARGMLMAVEKKISEPLNLGSGMGITIKDLVETIVNNFPEKKIAIKWDTTKPTGDKIRLMDMKKFTKLGFKCTTPISEGIKKTIEWFLKNKEYSSLKYNSFNQS